MFFERDNSMNPAESTATEPVATCPCREILDTLEGFDRRLSAVSRDMHQFGSGIDRLHHEMTETFRVLSDQNRRLVDLTERLVESFADLERAIVG